MEAELGGEVGLQAAVGPETAVVVEEPVEDAEGAALEFSPWIGRAFPDLELGA